MRYNTLFFKGKKMSDETSELKTDRRIIFLLIGTLITVLVASGSGFIVMYGEVKSTRAELNSANSRIDKVEQIQRDLSKSMSSIDKGVTVLVAMADERNKLLGEKNKKQEAFNKEMQGFRLEQVARIPRIKWVDKQMAKGK